MRLFPTKEYKDKINKEQSFYDTSWKSWIKRNDSWFQGRYLLHMRYAEWYTNNGKSYLHLILGGVNLFIMKKIAWRLGYQIGINTLGFGVKFYHHGWCIVNGKAKIGKNAILYPGVCVGQKSPGEVPEIGDNCFLGLSAKVMGKVKVGNNVTIAPNAVVTHNIPDNCVVAGVPAKIIKMK